MNPLNPTITKAGLALFPTPAVPGFKVTLTHIAFGSQKYATTGNEVALRAEVARFPIAAGGSPTPTSIQVGVTVKDQDPAGHLIGDQGIGEIGFFAGTTLFAVWSRADKNLFFKTAEIDVPLAYTLDVSALPASSVAVAVQLGTAAMQVLMFAHEAYADAHPQYITLPVGVQLITQHEAAANPHPQYLTQADVDGRYIKLGQLTTADVMKALLGARALRLFHASGM